MSSTCRTCRAPVLWATTEHGRKMPLDLEPYTGPEPGGLFILRGELAVAVTAAAFDDEPLYRSHFATCPQADQHRRPREARA